MGLSDLKREHKPALQHLHLPTEVVVHVQLVGAFQIVAVVLVILAEKMMKMFV